MNYKKLSFASILAVLILIAGCKGDTGPAGPALTGSIMGFVTLVDSAGNYLANNSGVTIAAQGTSFSTTTDSSGKWTLNGIPTGTYVITATKPSYGMTEQQGVELVGGNNPIGIGPFTIAQPPIDSIEIDSITTLANNEINVSFTISGKYDSTHNNQFLIAIGNNTRINSSDPNSFLFASTGDIQPPPPQGNMGLQLSSLEYSGFMSGMTVYVIMYPLGLSYSNYFDIPSGRNVYTSVGVPSKVFKIIIP